MEYSFSKLRDIKGTVIAHFLMPISILPTPDPKFHSQGWVHAFSRAAVRGSVSEIEWAGNNRSQMQSLGTGTGEQRAVPENRSACDGK